MSYENTWPPEIGVRFLERHFKLPGYSDQMSMIEVVGEHLGDYYFIHWLVDEEGIEIERRRHGRIETSGMRVVVDVPYELYEKMRGEALSFLVTAKSLDSIESLHEHVLTVDPQDRSKVSVRFKNRQRSAYRFTFCQKSNGEIVLIKTENHMTLTGERAQDGHKRAPLKVCHDAYAVVAKHFEGCLNSDDHTQCELDLTPQNASV